MNENKIKLCSRPTYYLQKAQFTLEHNPFIKILVGMRFVLCTAYIQIKVEKCPLINLKPDNPLSFKTLKM